MALATFPATWQIEEAIGRAALCSLVESYGGVVVRVHTLPQPESRLAKTLGIDAYRKLQALCAGEEILVPKLSADQRQWRNAEIHQSHAAGATAGELALRYDLHIRTIRGIIAKTARGHATEGLSPSERAARAHVKI